MTEALFSSGFAWGEPDPVAPADWLSQSRATAVATPATASEQAKADAVAPLATPVATPKPQVAPSDADLNPVLSKSPVASVASVAEPCAGQVYDGFVQQVSHTNVAGVATPVATAETAELRGSRGYGLPPVADVAAVANWLEGVGRMRAMRPGPPMCHGTWRRVIADGVAFIERWGDAAIAAGWSTLDVFGTNPDLRHHRVDRLGLMVCVGGRAIQAISATRAVIGEGSKMTVFDRTIRASGAVAVWNVDWEVQQ